MKGNEIVLTAEPLGNFDEGTISGTPKPGTVMMAKAATALVGGRATWQEASIGADGYPALPAVLIEDRYHGKLATDAYADGDRGYIYIPRSGDFMNMLVGEGGGTSNTVAIGDRYMMDSDSGILIPVTGSPAGPTWTAMEALTQVAAPGLVFMQFNGT